jgi:hypothetical protein
MATQIREMTLRMQIVWQTLEAAKDAGDGLVIDSCRRLITADRIGWRKHHEPRDWQIVKTFAER